MCDRQTTKKYTSRAGPAYPANSSACRSTKKRGNDGRMYKSKRASNGVYRWKLVSPKRRSPKKIRGGTGVKGVTGCKGRTWGQWYKGERCDDVQYAKEVKDEARRQTLNSIRLSGAHQLTGQGQGLGQIANA